MRYWVMSLAALFLMVSIADTQTGKKDKKPLAKEKAVEPTSPTITEIQGRTFREWQKDIQDKDPTRRELALKAILLFGADKAYAAVPDILVELKKHSNSKRIDLSTCTTGAAALSAIFQHKKGADPKEAKAAVAIYRTLLKDEQLMLRIQAVQGLVSFGPICRDALPEVISLAKEPSTWEARKEAVQVLGYIGYEDKGTPKIYVMAEVFKALDDRAAPVRIAAIRSSAALAMKAELPVKTQVFGKLRTAMADPEKHVVLAAHLAHMTLEGKATAAHLDPMTKLLKDRNPEIRLDALQNIGALGKEAKTAIPAVKECTEDPEASVASAAVMLLAGTDWENSRTFIERIKDNKKYPDAVRATAGNAIEYHDKMAKDKKTVDKK
jgi:HEAT repeat protein